MKYKICPDAILRFIEKENAWVLSNPRVRSHVQVTPEAMIAIMKNNSGFTEAELIQSLDKGLGWPRSRFTSSDGLLVDPTGCGKPKDTGLNGKDLFHVFLEAWILIPLENDSYDEFLKPKSNILDKAHMGTFHQALGCNLLLELHIKETWRWWHDQKFTPDGKQLRPGFYRDIQERFFEEYFRNNHLEGKKLIDFACGNGYFSEKFCQMGAQVTGVDTSKHLIDIARKNWSKEIDFVCPENETDCEKFLQSLRTGSFDRIYISDALLFFFYNFQAKGQRSQGLKNLLSEFRRLLKPEGALYIMEPNGTFWLAGWYGSDNKPWTVITEYRERLYHVAPTADKVIGALHEAGFLIQEYLHPEVDPAMELENPKMHSFAKAFPLWDFYCAVPDR